jgi:uncharacterized membrane protein (UPF0182 family)
LNRALSFRNKSLIILGIVLLLVVVFFTSITNYLIDYQWFSELNFQEVFFKKLITQIQFFVPAFIILFIIIFTYMKIINAHSEKKSGLGISVKARKTKNMLFGLISAAVALIFSMV